MGAVTVLYVGDPKVFYFESGSASLEPGDVVEVSEHEALSLSLFGEFTLVEDHYPTSSEEE